MVDKPNAGRDGSGEAEVVLEPVKYRGWSGRKSAALGREHRRNALAAVRAVRETYTRAISEGKSHEEASALANAQTVKIMEGEAGPIGDAENIKAQRAALKEQQDAEAAMGAPAQVEAIKMPSRRAQPTSTPPLPAADIAAIDDDEPSSRDTVIEVTDDDAARARVAPDPSKTDNKVKATKANAPRIAKPPKFNKT